MNFWGEQTKLSCLHLVLSKHTCIETNTQTITEQCTVSPFYLVVTFYLPIIYLCMSFSYRYENGSKYKLVVKYEIDSAQQITSMSAINTFYSRILFVMHNS